MDQLPLFGTSIAQCAGPTLHLYGKLLSKNAQNIKSTLRKTFAFGPDPRHNLDVYYPSSNPTGASCPVLMFSYGGGFFRGDRISPMIPEGLIYANIGHFFAEKCGYIVVIPDYRLVPQAKFPSGGEDIALAVQWLIENMDKLGGGQGARSLFMMGNSAGGAHLATFLLRPEFTNIIANITSKEDAYPLRLKTAILCSMPAHFEHSEPSRAQVLNVYFGKRVREDCPLGLLEACRREKRVFEFLPGVKVLMLTGSLDPEDEILGPSKEFTETWRSDGAESAAILETQIMERHNHISPAVSLGTGIAEEEAWGFQVAEFCNAAARNEEIPEKK